MDTIIKHYMEKPMTATELEEAQKFFDYAYEIMLLKFPLMLKTMQMPDVKWFSLKIKDEHNPAT